MGGLVIFPVGQEASLPPGAIRFDKNGTPRDRYKRPVILTPEGKYLPYTRVTTYVSACEDAAGLSGWRDEMLLKGALSSPELRKQLMATSPEDGPALRAMAEQLRHAGGSNLAAETGTRIHDLTERLDAGEELSDVAIEDAPLIASWVTWRFGQPKWIESEIFGVDHDLMVSGTADRVGLYPDCCELAHIYDLKTGKSLRYGLGKMAQQLALYAGMDRYDPDTGVTSKPPQLICMKTGLIIHLPLATAELEVVPLDLQMGLHAVALSGRVRKYRTNQNKVFKIR